MKIIVFSHTKRLVARCVCLFLVCAFFVILAGYVFLMKAVPAFSPAGETGKYEIRSRLLKEALDETGACSPGQAADIWAGGLIKRSAALQYAVMTKELKNQYAAQLEKNFPNWVTGVSSPFVDSFKIVKTENPDDGSFIFHLRFFLKTSTGPAGDYAAVLNVKREGNFWRIAAIRADEQLYPYTGFGAEPLN